MVTRRGLLKLGIGAGAAAVAGRVGMAPAQEPMPYAPEATPPGVTANNLPVFVPGVGRDNWTRVVIPGLAADGPLPPSSGSPESRFIAPAVFYRGDRASNRVYLTIDDGWSSSAVEQALAIGEQTGTRFTFFPVGTVVDGNPGLWARVAGAGHEIENHSYSHGYLSRLSDSAMRDQLRWQAEAVSRAVGGGYEPRFVRPPGGDGIFNYDPRFPSIALEMGMKVAMWDTDSNGWRLNPRTDGAAVAQVVANVFSTLRPGSIVVMHSISTDVAALPRIIAGIRERGLEPATLSQGIA